LSPKVVNYIVNCYLTKVVELGDFNYLQVVNYF